jgi:hypothetical protein
MAKWVLPRGGALLGQDILWETRVRYVTPPYFWFALWTSGNKWAKVNGVPKGAEYDLIESFGYDNGGTYKNYDGRYWHSDVVGGTETTPYNSGSWGYYMGTRGITNYDATQWHTWTWLYRKDNTFVAYVDGIPVQDGTSIWTYGSTLAGEAINMSFLFDAGWGNVGMASVNHSLAVSAFTGKYYEFDYSRVYLRSGSEGKTDLNADGKDDILWFNPATHANTVWLMNGTAYGSSAALTPAGGGWKMIGGADFNADGRPDILWRNAATGANGVWLMNGTSHSSSLSLEAVGDLNWKMIGAGDFNGDGKADILWRNPSTGADLVWLMDGAIHSSSAPLLAVTDPAWKMARTGDFNADGRPDILWRNASTGANTIWLMSGTTRTANTALSPVADLNWKMAGGQDNN